MIARNLTFFRFPASFEWPTMDPSVSTNDPDRATLSAFLEESAAKPVGPTELQSIGWVPPMGSASDSFAHRIGPAVWITLGGEKRILPPSVVNAALGRKVAQIEEAEGRKLGGRARRRLKEDLVAEMLPRALVRPFRVNAFLDLERGFLAVDTPSRRTAEAVVSELRFTLGSFPALPLNAEKSVRGILTDWVYSSDPPTDLFLGDEGELRDPADGGSIVRLQRQELRSEEIYRHLEAGKQCSRLGLIFGGLSFVFGEDLVVRKIRLLDVALESLAKLEVDDADDELEARFALFSGEVGRLFDALARAFQFSNPEG